MYGLIHENGDVIYESGFEENVWEWAIENGYAHLDELRGGYVIERLDDEEPEKIEAIE